MNADNYNIKNIENENSLNEYANSSFYIKKPFNNDDSNEWFNIIDLSFHNNYILNGSPVNSCNNSDIDLESNFNDKNDKKFKLMNGSEISGPLDYSSDDKSFIKTRNDSSKYKKLSYKDVEKFINKYYNIQSENKYSSELDILTTYINGQKNLYIQSKYITQYKLNLLSFPSIFVTAAVTMMAPFIECQVWSGGVISALNAILLLIISLTNYLKYETSIEAYIQNAKQYDKIISCYL